MNIDRLLAGKVNVDDFPISDVNFGLTILFMNWYEDADSAMYRMVIGEEVKTDALIKEIKSVLITLLTTPNEKDWNEMHMVLNWLTNRKRLLKEAKALKKAYEALTITANAMEVDVYDQNIIRRWAESN